MLREKRRKVINKPGIFLLISIMLQAGNAFAYEPEIGHKALSATALKIYTQCYESQTSYKSEAAQKRIIHGDLSMDLGLEFNVKDRISLKGEGVFSKLIRPFNWHFYNPDRAAFSKVGLVEQSHVKLWDDLIEGFNNNKTEYNKLLFVGGIIHLTEDLTVPAHVVPVYHGPTQIEYLGPTRLKPLVAYMQEKGDEYSSNIADKIDSIAPDTQRLEKELLDNKNICSKIETEKSSLEDIRSSTVKFTLDQIQNEIPNCPGVSWQDFWTKPTGDEFFGRYNVGRNNPLFGDAGVLVSSTDAKCRLDAMDTRYLDFVFALHLKAIEADMKVLYWGSRNM